MDKTIGINTQSIVDNIISDFYSLDKQTVPTKPNPPKPAPVWKPPVYGQSVDTSIKPAPVWKPSVYGQSVDTSISTPKFYGGGGGTSSGGSTSSGGDVWNPNVNVSENLGQSINIPTPIITAPKSTQVSEITSSSSFRGAVGTSVYDPKTGITTYGGTEGHTMGLTPSTRVQTWNQQTGQKISDTERVYISELEGTGRDPWVSLEEAYYRSGATSSQQAEAEEKYKKKASRYLTEEEAKKRVGGLVTQVKEVSTPLTGSQGIVPEYRELITITGERYTPDIGSTPIIQNGMIVGYDDNLKQQSVMLQTPIKVSSTTEKLVIPEQPFDTFSQKLSEAVSIGPSGQSVWKGDVFTGERIKTFTEGGKTVGYDTGKQSVLLPSELKPTPKQEKKNFWESIISKPIYSETGEVIDYQKPKGFSVPLDLAISTGVLATGLPNILASAAGKGVELTKDTILRYTEQQTRQPSVVEEISKVPEVISQVAKKVPGTVSTLKTGYPTAMDAFLAKTGGSLSQVDAFLAKLGGKLAPAVLAAPISLLNLPGYKSEIPSGQGFITTATAPSSIIEKSIITSEIKPTIPVDVQNTAIRIAEYNSLVNEYRTRSIVDKDETTKKNLQLQGEQLNTILGKKYPGIDVKSILADINKSLVFKSTGSTNTDIIASKLTGTTQVFGEKIPVLENGQVVGYQSGSESVLLPNITTTKVDTTKSSNLELPNLATSPIKFVETLSSYKSGLDYMFSKGRLSGEITNVAEEAAEKDYVENLNKYLDTGKVNLASIDNINSLYTLQNALSTYKKREEAGRTVIGEDKYILSMTPGQGDLRVVYLPEGVEKNVINNEGVKVGDTKVILWSPGSVQNIKSGETVGGNLMISSTDTEGKRLELRKNTNIEIGTTDKLIEDLNSELAKQQKTIDEAENKQEEPIDELRTHDESLLGTEGRLILIANSLRDSKKIYEMNVGEYNPDNKPIIQNGMIVGYENVNNNTTSMLKTPIPVSVEGDRLAITALEKEFLIAKQRNESHPVKAKEEITEADVNKHNEIANKIKNATEEIISLTDKYYDTSSILTDMITNRNIVADAYNKEEVVLNSLDPLSIANKHYKDVINKDNKVGIDYLKTIGALYAQNAIGAAKSLRGVIKFASSPVTFAIKDFSEGKTVRGIMDIAGFGSYRSIVDVTKPIEQWKVDWEALGGGINIAMMGGAYLGGLKSGEALKAVVKPTAKMIAKRLVKAGLIGGALVAGPEVVSIGPSGIGWGPLVTGKETFGDALSNMATRTGELAFTASLMSIGSNLGFRVGRTNTINQIKKVLETKKLKTDSAGNVYIIKKGQISPKTSETAIKTAEGGKISTSTAQGDLLQKGRAQSINVKLENGKTYKIEVENTWSPVEHAIKEKTGITYSSGDTYLQFRILDKNTPVTDWIKVESGVRLPGVVEKINPAFEQAKGLESTTQPVQRQIETGYVVHRVKRIDGKGYDYSVQRLNQVTALTSQKEGPITLGESNELYKALQNAVKLEGKSFNPRDFDTIVRGVRNADFGASIKLSKGQYDILESGQKLIDLYNKGSSKEIQQVFNIGTGSTGISLNEKMLVGLEKQRIYINTNPQTGQRIFTYGKYQKIPGFISEKVRFADLTVEQQQVLINDILKHPQGFVGTSGGKGSSVNLVSEEGAWKVNKLGDWEFIPKKSSVIEKVSNYFSEGWNQLWGSKGAGSQAVYRPTDTSSVLPGREGIYTTSSSGSGGVKTVLKTVSKTSPLTEYGTSNIMLSQVETGLKQLLNIKPSVSGFTREGAVVSLLDSSPASNELELLSTTGPVLKSLSSPALLEISKTVTSPEVIPEVAPIVVPRDTTLTTGGGEVITEPIVEPIFEPIINPEVTPSIYEPLITPGFGGFGGGGFGGDIGYGQGKYKRRRRVIEWLVTNPLRDLEAEYFAGIQNKQVGESWMSQKPMSELTADVMSKAKKDHKQEDELKRRRLLEGMEPQSDKEREVLRYAEDTLKELDKPRKVLDENNYTKYGKPNQLMPNRKISQKPQIGYEEQKKFNEEIDKGREQQRESIREFNRKERQREFNRNQKEDEKERILACFKIHPDLLSRNNQNYILPKKQVVQLTPHKYKSVSSLINNQQFFPIKRLVHRIILPKYRYRKPKVYNKGNDFIKNINTKLPKFRVNI